MPQTGIEPVLAFSEQDFKSCVSTYSTTGARVDLSPRSEELDAYLRTVRYSSWSFTELVQRAPFQVVVRVNKRLTLGRCSYG